jgi:hypothetical protein
LNQAFVNLVSLFDLLLEFAFSHFPALPTVGIRLGSYVSTLSTFWAMVASFIYRRKWEGRSPKFISRRATPICELCSYLISLNLAVPEKVRE